MIPDAFVYDTPIKDVNDSDNLNETSRPFSNFMNASTRPISQASDPFTDSQKLQNQPSSKNQSFASCVEDSEIQRKKAKTLKLVPCDIIEEQKTERRKSESSFCSSLCSSPRTPVVKQN